MKSRCVIQSPPAPTDLRKCQLSGVGFRHAAEFGGHRGQRGWREPRRRQWRRGGATIGTCLILDRSHEGGWLLVGNFRLVEQRSPWVHGLPSQDEFFLIIADNDRRPDGRRPLED